jgi:protein O-GlcNAc transferase
MAEPSVQQSFDVALQHHRAGRLQEAGALYRQILTQDPEHAPANHYLGVIAYQTGQLDTAVQMIHRAIAANPNYAEAHNDLGVVLTASGQFDQAIAAHRQAIALRPNYAEAFNNLGNAFTYKNQLDDAIAAYRQSVALRPNYLEAQNNLGVALRRNGQLDDAIAAHQKAIAIKPDSAQAHRDLGAAFYAKSDLDQSIAAYRQAISLEPNRPDDFNNLANALRAKGDLNEAIAAYRQAIALQPNFPEAHCNLGVALGNKGQLDDAIASYRQAIVLRPTFAQAHNNLGDALKDTGQLDEAITEFRQATALEPENAAFNSYLIYVLHLHPDYDARALAKEHRLWNDRHARPLAKLIRPHSNNRDPNRPLRIGYVSPDFRLHPVGRFLLPLLTNHDKNQFEIFCYSKTITPDPITQRLRSHANTWRKILGLSDIQTADLIRQDRSDILIDLTMHMVGNSLLMFAQKPAPIQVTYLAYCSTTGLQTIDYRLSDPHLDPIGSDESVYSEQTFRLPETYWCYQPITTPPDIIPPPVSTSASITFGCLNNFCKVSQPTLHTWIDLLRAVPNSNLLLSAHEGAYRQKILNQFSTNGIDPSRIKFVAKVLFSDYFRLYNQIDIALDTFPYAGGTTTCDALWMGVPVVTLIGKTAVGRGGSSILSNLGLPEMTAQSPEDYIRIAANLANNLPRLTQLRSTLRPRMEQSPLMDAARFAKNVEVAYRQMWRNWCTTPNPTK